MRLGFKVFTTKCALFDYYIKLLTTMIIKV